jgi:hypothetical protein
MSWPGVGGGGALEAAWPDAVVPPTDYGTLFFY